MRRQCEALIMRTKVMLTSSLSNRMTQRILFSPLVKSSASTAPQRPSMDEKLCEVSGTHIGSSS